MLGIHLPEVPKLCRNGKLFFFTSGSAEGHQDELGRGDTEVPTFRKAGPKPAAAKSEECPRAFLA